MSESEFQEEVVAAYLRERGYTVEKPDEADDEEQESPEDARGGRDVAHRLLDQLNASRTPWISMDVGGDPDAA
jgi:hypothetical protein